MATLAVSMISRTHAAVLLILNATTVLGACDGASRDPVDAAMRGWAAGASLPEPVANNAVTANAEPDGCVLYSMTGIDETRSSAGIHTRAARWHVGDASWEPIDDAPGLPRIAASAVSLRGRVHLLGGYSVASNGAETTHADHYVFDPAAPTWVPGRPLSIPVDDAVAVAWRDRWIVVVSGWSNTAPVSAVQIYDVDLDAWVAATAFPGAPVFGHAGAIIDDTLVVVDGVTSRAVRFELINQLWRAELDPGNPAVIAWSDGGQHAGPARYRAAAGASERRVFVQGGTAEPYNYDGLTYASGDPAQPLADALVIDLDDGGMTVTTAPRVPGSMDHRGFPSCGGSLFTIGGMEPGPIVTSSVWGFVP